MDIGKGFGGTTPDVDMNGLGPDPAAPKLPGKEVYNPAERSNCPLEIM
jgi:hypothetical protein